MPSIARIIGTHPKRGYWVYVNRKSATSVFGTVLDGRGVADSEGHQFDPSLFGDSYNITAQALDLGTASFRHFPTRVYGKISPGNPSGEYDVLGMQDAPTPVGQRNSLSKALASGPVTATVPSAPAPSASIAPASSAPAPSAPATSAPAPKPVVKRQPRKLVTPSMGAILGTSGENTPIVSLDRIGSQLDTWPIEYAFMIWGPSGIGKSAAVQQYAAERNLKIYDVRLNQLEPSDIKGIGVPDVENDVCHWLPSEYFPQGPNTILFLDEITSAPPALQSLAYQLTYDRAVGNRPLPADCRVICAGNRTSDRGVAHTMVSPLANRLLHITVKPDIAAWRKWAYTAGIDPRVVSFLSFKPDFLHQMTPTNFSGAWPSPRSWAAASRALTSSFTAVDMGIAIAQAVGVEACKEFIRHCEDYTKYTRKVEGILDGFEKSYVESDPAKAMTVAVAVVANATDDSKTLTNIVEWAKKQNEEYASVVMRGLEDRFGEELIMEVPGASSLGKSKLSDSLKF
jgi:hypothetical protein